MSLNMFKCQVPNVFDQFKWVLCKNCHHSSFLCVALFQNCASRLFQFGNLLLSFFNFALVLKRGWIDTFFSEGLPYRPSFLFSRDYLAALLSHNNWTLPSSLRWDCCCVLDLTLCQTFQNIAKLCSSAAVLGTDECFRCFERPTWRSLDVLF